MEQDNIESRTGFSNSVELPNTVKDMATVDGRLMVALVDGRSIDMTDWFADKCEKPN